MTVDGFNYIKDITPKYRSLIPVDLCIILGPYNLRAIVNHHTRDRNYMHHDHYTAFVNCCGKTFCSNGDRITECDLINARNSSTAYILFYALIVKCLWPDRGGLEFINIHAAGTAVYHIDYRSKISKKTCGVGNMFPPDDLSIGLDTYTNCALIYNLHSEV